MLPLFQQFNNVSVKGDLSRHYPNNLINVSVKGDGSRRYPSNLFSLDMSTCCGDESRHYSSNLIMFLLKVMEVAVIPAI